VPFAAPQLGTRQTMVAEHVAKNCARRNFQSLLHAVDANIQLHEVTCEQVDMIILFLTLCGFEQSALYHHCEHAAAVFRGSAEIATQLDMVRRKLPGFESG